MKTERHKIARFEEGERKGYQWSINDQDRVEYACWVAPKSDGSYRAESRAGYNGENFKYDLGTFSDFDSADKHIRENILEDVSKYVDAVNSADDWFQKPMDLGHGPIPTTNEDMLFILGFQPRKDRVRATLVNLID